MKYLLFILAICFCLMGCIPEKQITTATEKADRLVVTIDSHLLAPMPTIYTVDVWAQKRFTDAVQELGISIVIEKVAVYRGINSLGIVLTCSVPGVSDSATLECVAKTLRDIPFVINVRPLVKVNKH